jgi:hypothetical protein
MPEQQLSRSTTRVAGFSDDELDFQLIRQLGSAAYGGASVGETLALVPGISNPEDWVDHFAALAERQQADGAQRARRGHAVSARDSLLRSANSFRAAAYFARFGEARQRNLNDAARDAFLAAMQHADHDFEDVGYDLEGRRMPAYWLAPKGATGPGPTLLATSGFDGTLEEIYFAVGLAGVQRGWRVLLLAGPGQMDTARDHPDLTFVPDTERWVSAALDAVLARPEIDPERVGLLGISFGGYFVARAAAHDGRVRALVANSPIVDLRAYMVSFAGMDPDQLPAEEDFGVPDIPDIPDGEMPPPIKEMSRMLIMRFGQPTFKATFDRLREFAIDDLSAIRCPALAMLGEGEGGEPAAQAQRFADGVAGPVTTYAFTAAEGAEMHCQMGNLGLSNAVAFDWLEETFAATTPARDLPQRFLGAVARGDFAAAASLAAPDFRFSTPRSGEVALEPWLDIYRSLLRAIPDLAFTVSDVEEDGNRVTGSLRTTGTHTGPLDLPMMGVEGLAPSGASIDLPLEHFEMQVADGRIHAIVSRPPADGGLSGLLRQLGARRT